MKRGWLVPFVVALALGWGGSCKKKEEPKAPGATGKVEDHWGPNCRAYFAAVDDACKPPHDQGSACKSWVTGIQMMKQRPKDHADNARAEQMGCNMLLGAVQRTVKERK